MTDLARPRHWRDEPRRRFEKGDRVRFRRERGTVVDAWHSASSLSETGRDWVRIELDNCKVLTCRAEEVRAA